MLPNVPDFAFVYYGILRAGGVVVPMNVLLKAREVEFDLTDSAAGLLFAWHGFADAAESGARAAGADVFVVAPGEFEELLGRTEPTTGVADADDTDTAVMLYTSGTTGKPKGAELTHLNLPAAGRGRHCALRADSQRCRSRRAAPFPRLRTDVRDECVRGRRRVPHAAASLRPADALETLQRDRVTIFEGVPTMYSALLHCKQRDEFDTSRLRLCVSGGAALPGEVLRGFEDAFACKVLEGYGLSETSPVASFNHRDRERKVGSIGTPIEGVEMKIVDDEGHELPHGEVGEIVIRGHNLMKGYWMRPQATAEAIKDGWFHTGDLARIDEDGYFFIVDRKKEMIIRGGYNVYPREIEEVLYEHPAVREAAVIGIPHDDLGEEVAAAVALNEGANLQPAELRTYVRELVAAYKYPREIWFVDELPKGPTGKILKREIRPPGALDGVGRMARSVRRPVSVKWHRGRQERKRR